MKKWHESIIAGSLFIVVLCFGALASEATANDGDTKVHAGYTESDIPGLIEQLGSQNTSVASKATDALAGMGPKAVPYLIDALESGGNYYGILAFLWGIRDERAVRPVAKYINDKSWDVADRARGVLRVYGDISVPALVELLKDQSYRDASLDVLKGVKPSDESLKLVRPLVGSADAGERGGAAIILGWWKDTKSAGQIEGLLKDTAPDVRRDALDGYGMLYSDSPQNMNQNILVDILKNDQYPDIRDKAVMLLRSELTGNIVGALIEEMKKEKDKKVLYTVLLAAGETKDQIVVVPLLEALLREGDPKLKAAAILSLGDVKAQEAVPYILDIFKKRVDSDELLQSSFLALKNIGKPVDVKIFLKYLDIDDREGSTRQLIELIDAMAAPGDKEVIDTLESYKKKTVNPDLGEKAEEVLKKIR